MAFYFAWANSECAFDPEIHAREDLKIFSLEIIAREGGFPMAKLRVQNQEKGLGGDPKQQTAYLSFKKSGGEIELLFKGRLCKVPEKIEGDSYQIQLTSEPENSQGLLQVLHERVQQGPFWDSAFVHPEEQDNPGEGLEAQDCLFEWSRTHQTVQLSNLFKGRQILNVGDRFFRNSLDIKMTDLPLAGVKIKLKASWLQTYRGRTNITYFLRSKFPGGLINTLTGPDLQAKWWHEGQKLNQSGYWIEESRLKEIPAPYTGILDLYPAKSNKIWVSPEDPSIRGRLEPFQTRLKRFWYRAALVLGWRYRQRRCEVAEIYLGHQTQPLGPGMKKVRTLSMPIHGVGLSDEQRFWRSDTLYPKGLRVTYRQGVYESLHHHRSSLSFERDYVKWRHLGKAPDIPCVKGRSSFFTTERGHQCVAHAFDVARAHLAASARAVEIRFESSFESLSSITCDHTVQIEDGRLPGKNVSGKVKSYRLLVDGEKGISRGEVTLACAVGVLNHELDQELKQDSAYVGTSYCKENLGQEVIMVSESGIKFPTFYHDVPQRGLLKPNLMTAYDLVEDVEIVKGPDEQNIYLSENQYPKRHNLQSVLREARTDIKVRLKDLRSEPAIVHNIKIKAAHTWSAPCQIQLNYQP